MIDPKRKAYLDAAAAMIDGDISSIDAETLQLALEAASEESDNTLAAVIQLELSARDDLELSDRFDADMRLELDRRDIKGYTRKLKNGTVVHVKPHARVFKELGGNLDNLTDEGLARRADNPDNPDVSFVGAKPPKLRADEMNAPPRQSRDASESPVVDKSAEGKPAKLSQDPKKWNVGQQIDMNGESGVVSGKTLSGFTVNWDDGNKQRFANDDVYVEGIVAVPPKDESNPATWQKGQKVAGKGGAGVIVQNDGSRIQIEFGDAASPHVAKEWFSYDAARKEGLLPDADKPNKKADLSRDFESSMLSSDNKNTRGGVTVGTATTRERATGVDASKLALDLSDAQATIAEQQKQLDSMRSREHARDVEDAAVALQKRGLPSAFCVEARELMLADDGGPVLELNLSDEEGGKQTVTVRGIVERLSNTLFDEEGKSLLRKQASDELNLSDEERPKNAPDSKTTTERADEIAAELGMEKK